MSGEYSKCPLVVRMQAWRRLRHWSIPSPIAVPLQHTHTNQMPPQIVHILLFSGRLAAPDFVTKCTEVRALR